MGRLTQALGLDQRTETFTYDLRGNVGTKSKPGTSDPTIDYEGGPHHAESYDNVTNMDYDENGRRELKALSGGGQEIYDYDPLGRLTRITLQPSGKTVDFTYDHMDRRVAKTVNGGVPYRYFSRYLESANGLFTKYYYVGDRLVATREAQTSQFSEIGPGVGPSGEPWVLSPVVVYGIGAVVLVLLAAPGHGRVCVGVAVARGRAFGMAIAVVVGTSPVLLAGDCDPGDNPIFRHYHFDHLESLQAVTKEDGGLVYQVRSWAYGEVRGRFNGAGNPIATNQDYRYEFTGYETEFESGLAYAGARFYDPEIAQFLTQDPRQQFASPYAYGPGDPLNGIDPSGEFWDVVVALGIIIAGTALSASSRGASQRDSFGAALHAATSAATTLANGPTRSAGHSTTHSAVAQRSVQTASAGLNGTSASLASGGKPLGAVRSALDSYGLAYAFNEGVAGNSASASASGSSQGGPRPLAGYEQQFLEDLTGESFSGVRVDEGFFGERFAAGQVRSDNEINVFSGFSSLPRTERLALLAHESVHILQRRSGTLTNLGGFTSHLGAALTGRDLYAIPSGFRGRFSQLNFEQQGVILENAGRLSLGQSPGQFLYGRNLGVADIKLLYTDFLVGR